ncbi:bola-like protein [Sodiomyces alkalinus F11]|uniref:Bola-like protein n=1 Tax=Sodiomyces alkalinus (strain CBS 110278 / VKM F-3762 / F11) TaxID=1314773 RepID=A0A3N2PNR5_SODAK|nr:bola-like protein [Sodiomyces alkalinus F11]ROT36158.1 bola-like protein [Sodiomyces alkalinus F11]
MICRVCQRALAGHRTPIATPNALLRPSSRALSTATAPSRTLPSIAASTSVPSALPRNLARLDRLSTIRQYSQSATESSSSSASQSPSPSSSSPAPPTVEKPDHLDSAESWIWDKLAAEFAPVELDVRDVSGGCGSMYAIDIASPRFAGLTMLKQQRMVNAVLGDRVKEWHGLQLRTRVA